MFINFIMDFMACLLAILVFFTIYESSESNINIFHRMRDFRYNYLAIIYKDVESARLASVMSDDDIYKMVNDKYKTRTYRFQKSNSTDKKYLDDLAFVENVITDKSLLLWFLNTSVFDKKAFKTIEEKVNLDEKTKSAMSQIQHILKDKSPENIDNTISWLVKLLTTPFIKDPENPDREIRVVENYITIYHICKGTYFLDDLQAKQYLKALKSLKQVHPAISIPSSNGHDGDICLDKQTARVQLVRDTINDAYK